MKWEPKSGWQGICKLHWHADLLAVLLGLLFSDRVQRKVAHQGDVV